MKAYIKLLRPKHYIKNALIFVPAFFAGDIFQIETISSLLLAFAAFSLTSSLIYIVNDIRDVEKDRLHEVKRNRPIASGKVSVRNAVILGVFTGALALIIQVAAVQGHWSWTYLYLGCYLLINFAYSFGLKNVPIVDICILAAGFVIRLIYGASITDTSVSQWLFLTIMVFSLYLGLGKRRNEIDRQRDGDTRTVLKHYTYTFLDKNMHMCLTLGLVFYSLWTVNMSNGFLNDNGLIWTVPLVIMITMKYGLIIEGDSFGDPVDVLFSDYVLLILIILYVLLICAIMYGSVLWSYFT